MGHNEPVTPVFQNSDFCTGIIGVAATLLALVERGEKGGSYTVEVSLNDYNRWLTNTVGEYPRDAWERVWERNGREVFRHSDGMNVTIPRYLRMIRENSKDILLKEDFFDMRESGALGGVKLKCVAPALKFLDGEGRKIGDFGFNVGTRGNGVDEARWPDDPMTDVGLKRLRKT